VFCPKCRCEFEGWTDTCPNCGIPLVSELPPDPGAGGKSISYEALVELVRENGGELEIGVSATDIGLERKWSFPYFGYGYAWAKRLQGVLNGIAVDLTTTEVGRERKRRFPYFGYGFAWVKRMHGDIGGNEFALEATKVCREEKQHFPWLGRGYAWSQEMSGQCGDALSVDFSTADVGRRKETRFPYLGYGLAWENRGTLTFKLK
jgi:hypothetical protein